MCHKQKKWSFVGTSKSFSQYHCSSVLPPSARCVSWGGGVHARVIKATNIPPSFKIIFIVVLELLMRKYDFSMLTVMYIYNTREQWKKRLNVVLFCFLFRKSQGRFWALPSYIGNDVCGFSEVVQGNDEIMLWKRPYIIPSILIALLNVVSWYSCCFYQ